MFRGSQYLSFHFHVEIQSSRERECVTLDPNRSHWNTEYFKLQNQWCTRTYAHVHTGTLTVHLNEKPRLSGIQKSGRETSCEGRPRRESCLRMTWMWYHSPGKVMGGRGEGESVGLSNAIENCDKWHCWEVDQDKYREMNIGFDHWKGPFYWGWERHGANWRVDWKERRWDRKSGSCQKLSMLFTLPLQY